MIYKTPGIMKPYLMPRFLYDYGSLEINGQTIVAIRHDGCLRYFISCFAKAINCKNIHAYARLAENYGAVFSPPLKDGRYNTVTLEDLREIIRPMTRDQRAAADQAIALLEVYEAGRTGWKVPREGRWVNGMAMMRKGREHADVMS